MCTPQAGTLLTSLVVGMVTAKEMLCAHMANSITLPKGALVIENQVNRATVSVLKGVGINMAMLPQETLYVPQDKVTAKMWAREGHTPQVLSE